MATMSSLEHRASAEPEIPRFDDGKINIQEFICAMAETLVEKIMDAQAEEVCADGTQRNGYRERTLTIA